MESSVFVEFRFWLLIFLSVVVPVFMYLLQRKKREASPLFVLAFGLVLIAISGVDIYLLQALAAAARLTLSLADNAIFDSEISLGLYAFPFLFGGIGVNMISDMMVGHLMHAEEQYEKRHATPSSQFRRKRQHDVVPPFLQVQLRKSASGNSSVALPFAGQAVLRGKVKVLLQYLKPNTQTRGILLHELLDPAFVATYTHFSSIDDMFETGGCRATPQEDCNNLSGESWNAFVRSTTQFNGWEAMLQYACCHWMANQLLADPPSRARLRTACNLVPAVTTVVQPYGPLWDGGFPVATHGRNKMGSFGDRGGIIQGGI
ncbi:MAG: hypothetical protein ACREPL_10915 [Rhodanobacteraceae bacterium]